MFNQKREDLRELGAEKTIREIAQQPLLWSEIFQVYQQQFLQIEAFLSGIVEQHQQIRVIFTGAGTSAYVGEILVPFLANQSEYQNFTFESIASTDLVATPQDYLNATKPTLLVSFARSGNSPESMQAVTVAKQSIANLYQVTITCASEGMLAKQAGNDTNNLLLLLPQATNDQGFAMTSSFTCMLLMAGLVFSSEELTKKEAIIKEVVMMGRHALASEKQIMQYVNLNFTRVAYLGAGVFTGLAREAQLKLLELTAGKITTCFDSSLGFRHGPKSFIDAKTIVVMFFSQHEYTQKYDFDMAKELLADDVAAEVILLTKKVIPDVTHQFLVGEACQIKSHDFYLCFPYVMFAQMFAVLTAIKLKNSPDNPSVNGTVNRVVEGVKIHPYQNKK